MYYFRILNVLFFQETTNVVVECQKPSVDFFKDIFLDDSDDDTDIQEPLKINNIPNNSNNRDINSSNVVPENKEKLKPNVSNTAPFNLFPPKGIFANLNFEDLFDSSDKTNENEKKITPVNNIQKDIYGPFMPEHKIENASNAATVKSISKVESTFMEDEWVEKSELSNDKLSHKNKHSKSKKHKHKHKSKKKSHKHK